MSHISPCVMREVSSFNLLNNEEMFNFLFIVNVFHIDFNQLVANVILFSRPAWNYYSATEHDGIPTAAGHYGIPTAAGHDGIHPATRCNGNDTTTNDDWKPTTVWRSWWICSTNQFFSDVLCQISTGNQRRFCQLWQITSRLVIKSIRCLLV